MRSKPTLQFIPPRFKLSAHTSLSYLQDNKKQQPFESTKAMLQVFLEKVTTTHLFSVEPLEGWQNLLAKFHGIAPPVVWKILIKTCTVKILKYFFSLDGSLKIKVLTKYYKNLTNQYRGEEKGKKETPLPQNNLFSFGWMPESVLNNLRSSFGGCSSCVRFDMPP